MRMSVKRSERFLLAMSAALPSFLTVATLTWSNVDTRPGVVAYAATAVGFSLIFAAI